MFLKKMALPSLISMAFASSAFAASDLSLYIVGEVVTNTCEVTASGEAATGTLTIGNWSPNDFKAGRVGAGSLMTVGEEKPFVISLSDCSIAGATDIRLQSTNVLRSTSDGDIFNLAGGSNAGAIIYKIADTKAMSVGDTVSITTTGNPGAASGSVSMATTMAIPNSETPTPGTVNAAIQFLMAPN